MFSMGWMMGVHRGVCFHQGKEEAFLRKKLLTEKGRTGRSCGKSWERDPGLSFPISSNRSNREHFTEHLLAAWHSLRASLTLYLCLFYYFTLQMTKLKPEMLRNGPHVGPPVHRRADLDSWSLFCQHPWICYGSLRHREAEQAGVWRTRSP